ncbi:MAG: NADH-quinone oxidoreductase subunit NuoE [Deltaproteobacteria bacterium]|nr:NADH-quinone oxidoreductase subunit NuoE [Deltaproteobacteria bacterium]
MLSKDAIEKIDKIIAKYANKKSACMPAMQVVQAEKGHLTKEDMADIAAYLGIEPVDVHEVGAFYTMYNVEKPVGKYHVQVCRNISCSLLGAEHIVKHIEARLGIKTGQTTADKKFTLSTVECLGSCGTAPMMQVNDDFHENLTPGGVDEILNGLK